MCAISWHICFSRFSSDGPSIHRCRSLVPLQGGWCRGVFVAGAVLLLSYQLQRRETECAWEKGRNDPVVWVGSWATAFCSFPSPLAASWQQGCELSPGYLCPPGLAFHSQEQLSLQFSAPVALLALLQDMQLQHSCFPGYTGILEVGTNI